MAIFNRFVKFYIFLSVIFFSHFCLSLDESRLWLPISYQPLYLKLKEAALKAESLERCVDVLAGTLDLDASEENLPIYRIRCRQPDGSVYVEMVDGFSMKTLTTPVIEVIPLTEEEKEQLRLEEERKKLEEIQIRKQTLWSLCDTEISKKTRLMTNLVRLTDSMPEPTTFEDDLAVFNMDFDAESVSGDKLVFRAKCVVVGGSEIQLKMGKRPEGE